MVHTIGKTALPVRSDNHRQINMTYRPPQATAAIMSRNPGRPDKKLMASSHPWHRRQTQASHLTIGQEPNRGMSGRSVYGQDARVATEVERFSKRGPWVISSLGFNIRALGRAGMEYRQGDDRLHVDSEALAIKAFVVYFGSIPEERRLEIQSNITRAWR